MTEEADYVTVQRHTTPGLYNAVVMHWQREDEYVVQRCSRPLDLQRASQLAKVWAKERKVGIR